MTYRQLEERVCQFGHAMLSMGVKPENRILFLLDDSSDLIAAYLAAMKIGAVSVAFNLRTVAKDLKYVIEESRAVLLFIDSDLLTIYEAIEGSLKESPALVINGLTDRSEQTVEDLAVAEARKALRQPMDLSHQIDLFGTA